MAVITISREFGSGGTDIARRICKELDLQFFEKRLMDKVASEMGLSEQEVIDFSEESYEAKTFLERLLKSKSTVAEIGSWTQDTNGAWTKIVQKIGEEESVAFVKSLILAAAKKDDVVIVGRGGQSILKDTTGVLHIRVVAPVDARIQCVQQRENISREEAKKMVEKRDRATIEYIKRFHHIEVSDSTYYHLVINTGKWDVDTAIKIIINAVNDLS